VAVGKRLRFEIFKRDNFTCRYCGNKSPKVILEVDHIVPVSEGGSDDEMNLATSCFDCNRGKSNRNLSEQITGEDPHDKAIFLAERERQLQEYNYIQSQIEERISKEVHWLASNFRINEYVERALRQILYDNSVYDVSRALEIAIEKRGRHSVDCIPYLKGILRNWANEKKETA